MSVYLDSGEEELIAKDLRRDHLIAWRFSDCRLGQSLPIYGCLVFRKVRPRHGSGGSARPLSAGRARPAPRPAPEGGAGRHRRRAYVSAAR